MDFTTVLVLVIAGLVIGFPVLFIWYLNFGGVYMAVKKKWFSNNLEEVAGMICSINADCPEGYVCVNGRCLPA